MTSPLAAFSALLALMLLGLAAWLILHEPERQLVTRVRGITREAVRSDEPAVVTPNIRMPDRNGNKLLRLLQRLTAFNPEMPQERIIPWPLVSVLCIASSALAFSLGNFYSGFSFGIICGAAGAMLGARAIFNWQHQRYCKALFRQLPDALGLILRAIRAGLPMNEAIRTVAREMPSPTNEQFTRVMGEAGIGQPIDAAFLRLYQRSGLTEYAFLSVTLGLQANAGGSLAETLENLADMVRKRVAMEARARALASEARTSAFIVAALPFVTGLGMSVIRPGYLSVFWSNPTGFKMMVTGLGLMFAGVLVIRWLIRRATVD